MRLGWAIVAGLALGGAIGGWNAWQERRARGPGPAAASAPAPETGRAQAARPLYRWRDEAGVLHVTDAPPAGRSFEEVRLREDQNVVTMSGPAPEPTDD